MRHSDLKGCPQCGAPMSALPDLMRHQVVTCTFCRAQVTIEPEPLAAPPPPAAPAPFAPFPIQAMIPPPAVRRQTRSPMAVLVALPLLIMAGTVIPVLFAGGPGGFKGFMRKLSSNPFPLVCGMNETIVLEGKTSDLQDTLIEAKTNCKLRIKKCHLKGTTIIRAEHNADIEIESSTLEASQGAIEAGYNVKIRIDASTLKAGHTGITADANPKVTMRGKSTLSAKNAGLELGDNAELDLDGSTIDAAVQGVITKSNAKLKLVNGSVVKGASSSALHTLINGNVSVLSNSRLESQGTCLLGGMSTTLLVRNSTLQGKVAWDLGASGRVSLVSSKTFGARKAASGGSVDEQ